MAADPSRAQRIGARIREARDRKELTQADLARLLPAPVDSAYVSRWERGENIPSWAHLDALAAALGVTVGWLVDEG